MLADLAFNLLDGVIKDGVDGFECGVVHVNDLIFLKRVGFEVFLHDLLDAITGVAFVEKAINAAVFHFRHVGDEPQHACKRGEIKVDVEGLVCIFDDAGMVCIDSG